MGLRIFKFRVNGEGIGFSDYIFFDCFQSFRGFLSGRISLSLFHDTTFQRLEVPAWVQAK